MRISSRLLAVLPLGLAFPSPALSQEAETSAQKEPLQAETEASAEEPDRLSGLETLVGELRDGAPEAGDGGLDSAEPPAAGDPAPLPPPLTDEERERIEAAVLRGRQLFALARAGFLTTQDMLARIADPEGEGIIGWVAAPEGNALAVTYYSEGKEGPVAVYRGTVLGGRVVSRDIYPAGGRPALPPALSRMAEARNAAGALEREACGATPFNVFVMPPAEPGGPIDVYHVTPPAGPGRYPLGGHYRTQVAADGTVAKAHAFAEGCPVLELPEIAEGERPAPIPVARLSDPLPTEMHVFSALMVRRPLLVSAGAPARVWLVTGESVTLSRD